MFFVLCQKLAPLPKIYDSRTWAAQKVTQYLRQMTQWHTSSTFLSASSNCSRFYIFVFSSCCSCSCFTISSNWHNLMPLGAYEDFRAFWAFQASLSLSNLSKLSNFSIFSEFFKIINCLKSLAFQNSYVAFQNS